MLLKWTQDEDQELAKIIRRHGTSDWALIRKHFKSNRSRDSVIKRWHGKLKFERPHVEPPEKTKKIVSEKKKDPPPKRIRVNRKFNAVNTRRERERDQKTSINPAPPARRSRFQRLRNFLQGTKAERAKKVQQREQQKAASESSESESSESSEESEKSSSHEVVFEWSKMDDDKLLSLVLQEGVTGWDRISAEIGCSQKQVRNRWQQVIYNSFKLDDKVGGFHKYSVEEDSILSMAYRNGLDWTQIMSFLPGRTEFSIEARWRRLSRPQLQVELSKNKHYISRQFLKKIIEKRRGERQMVEEHPTNDVQPPKQL